VGAIGQDRSAVVVALAGGGIEACRPDSGGDQFAAVDAGVGALDYVPVLRTRCGSSGSEIFWPGALRSQAGSVVLCAARRRTAVVVGSVIILSIIVLMVGMTFVWSKRR
jgi:hypothetical protein